MKLVLKSYISHDRFYAYTHTHTHTYTHTHTHSQTFKHTLGRIMVVNIQKLKQEKQVLNTIHIYNFVKYILRCNQICKKKKKKKKKPEAAEYRFE